MKKGSLRDFKKYLEVKSELPIKVIEMLENAYHHSNSIHFNMVLDFVYGLYRGEKLSVWDARTIDKYYSSVFTENIVGKEKADLIESLVDMANDSM